MPPGRSTRHASATTVKRVRDVLQALPRGDHVERRVAERQVGDIGPDDLVEAVPERLAERHLRQVDAHRAIPLADRVRAEQASAAGDVEQPSLLVAGGGDEVGASARDPAQRCQRPARIPPLVGESVVVGDEVLPDP
ncbi:hypothetical protein ACVW19_005299 [Streptomyces sp. TE5632]